MKHLTKLSLAITAIVMLFISYSCNKEQVKPSDIGKGNESVEIRTEGLCEEAQGLCTGPYTLKTLIFPNGIPSYPNCTMHIIVKYRVCSAGIDMVYVGPVGIESSANDPDCLQAQIDTNNPSTVEAATLQIENELLEQALYKLGIEEYVGIGGLLPECGLNPSVQLRMTRSACAKACVFPDPTDPRGLGFVLVPCGNNCCQSTFELCFDTSTGKVKLTQTSNIEPATPCEIGAPDLPCPINTIYSTQCRPRCSNIAQGG